MAVVSCSSSSDKLPPTETPHSLPLLWLNLDSRHTLPERVENQIIGEMHLLVFIFSEAGSERCIFLLPVVNEVLRVICQSPCVVTGDTKYSHRLVTVL